MSPAAVERDERTAAVENACRTLVGHQTLNSAAGAIHAAGWASLDGDVQLAREDVGRHNALDKLIGAMLAGGVDARAGFLVVTSRASFDRPVILPSLAHISACMM